MGQEGDSVAFRNVSERVACTCVGGNGYVV